MWNTLAVKIIREKVRIYNGVFCFLYMFKWSLNFL